MTTAIERRVRSADGTAIASTLVGSGPPLVIVDGRHFVHRFHIDHARAAVAIEQPNRAKPMSQRFDEIWATGESGVPPTVLGL